MARRQIRKTWLRIALISKIKCITQNNKLLIRIIVICYRLDITSDNCYQNFLVINDQSTKARQVCRKVEYLIGNGLGHARELLSHDRLVKQTRRLVLLLGLRRRQHDGQIFATRLNRHRLSVRQPYIFVWLRQLGKHHIQ